MFTGLIEEKGKIARREPRNSGVRLTVNAPKISADITIGDSVSVNGACLTATTIAPPMMEFDVVPETVSRSTISRLKVGDSVNLERALRAGDRLGGHMVQGHVDGVGVIREIRRNGNEAIFSIEASPQIMEYIVEKGSIAVDGISLTVASSDSGRFSVAVIPHTLSNTALGDLVVGSAVNLETDIIGKYVYKFVNRISTTSDENLMNKLSEGGFLD